MSEYISFFARHQDSNKIIELATYSRSSYMFRVFQTAPYEKIRLLRTGDIDVGREHLKAIKRDYKVAIKEHKEKIEAIMSLPVINPEDAMYMIENYNDIIKEAKEEIRQIKYYINVLDFLKEVAEQEDNVLYIGKEIYKPTIEDII